VSTDYDHVRDAIVYIAEHAAEQPGLDEVAAHVGMSPTHLQRVFTRWAGVSPKRYLQHLTAQRARELLRDSVPVLDASFASGLSSAGRLHDLIINTDAMTPGQYGRRGAGIEIRYGFGDTPYGRALVALTERGICSLRFSDSDDDIAVQELADDWSRAALTRDDAATREVLMRAFGGAGGDAMPVHLKGTNFQLKVWEALLRVPEGAVVSYSDLAQRIGEPAAHRAVANAVGANPVAFLIPCHRVLRASGELGGYRWGTDRKLVILERELLSTSHG
jgi:AraC family transcriptional regulator of adaptative response/methylated-DNA-[protein]-cysteine methyltransferase